MNEQSGSAFKYGGHMYMWLERWSDEHLSLLNHICDLDLDLFEVSLGDDAQISPQKLRRAAESLDLELTVGPGGVWPLECDISDPNPQHRALGIAWHKRIINLAAESGALAYCGATYGHPGRVLKSRPDPDEYSRTAEGLHRLAEYGRRAGVQIVIEPMSRFRTHVVNTPEQAVRLVKMSDHPNLFITLDTYHMITEVRDYSAAIHTAAKYLWGLHACENDRGVPGGGLVPWDKVFDALLAVKPNARIMLETYNTSLNDLAFSRGIFQDLCPDPDAYTRQGTAFLKQSAKAAALRSRPPATK